MQVCFFDFEPVKTELRNEKDNGYNKIVNELRGGKEMIWFISGGLLGAGLGWFTFWA